MHEFRIYYVRRLNNGDRERKLVAIRLISGNRGPKVWNYKHETELKWTCHAILV